MAHELDFSTGDAAFVEMGDRVTAWHRHGRVIRPEDFDELTGEEKVDLILQAGRLDWTVDAFDLRDETGQTVPGWQAFRRSDTDALMTVAPSTYTILQNRELLTLVEPLLDEGIFQFETGGALRGGEDVWGLFRFNPQDPAVEAYFEEEGIIPFALLANNHTRSRKVVIMETPIRVVCANTLGMALGAHGSKSRGRYPGAVTIRHTKNVRSLSVSAVQELWGEITDRYAAVAVSYTQMKRRYLTAEEWEGVVLDQLAPLPSNPESKQFQSTFERAMERRHLLTTLAQGDGRGITGDGSAWEAYMATTEALDHYPEQFPLRTDDRLEGIFPGGSLANKKQDVLNDLYALSV